MVFFRTFLTSSHPLYRIFLVLLFVVYKVGRECFLASSVFSSHISLVEFSPLSPVYCRRTDWRYSLPPCPFASPVDSRQSVFAAHSLFSSIRFFAKTRGLNTVRHKEMVFFYFGTFFREFSHLSSPSATSPGDCQRHARTFFFFL